MRAARPALGGAVPGGGRRLPAGGLDRLSRPRGGGRHPGRGVLLFAAADAALKGAAARRPRRGAHPLPVPVRAADLPRLHTLGAHRRRHLQLGVHLCGGAALRHVPRRQVPPFPRRIRVLRRGRRRGGHRHGPLPGAVRLPGGGDTGAAACLRPAARQRSGAVRAGHLAAPFHLRKRFCRCARPHRHGGFRPVCRRGIGAAAHGKDRHGGIRIPFRRLYALLYPLFCLGGPAVGVHFPFLLPLFIGAVHPLPVVRPGARTVDTGAARAGAPL